VRRELLRIEGKPFGTKKAEKLIVGNISTSYQLTEKGLERLRVIIESLCSTKSESLELDKKIRDTRGKFGKVVREIENHPMYKNYLSKGEGMEVSESLLRDLLFSTMETSNQKLREKMKTLLDYSKTLQRNDIKEFLRYICRKYDNIFNQ
jgi:DNA-binding PadR family transcriptional regulator